MLVGLRVTIREPLLPVGADPSETVGACAPGIIHMKQPSRRRPGAGGLARVQPRTQPPQLSDEPKHRVGIACDARVDRACGFGADAVELEIRHAVVANDACAEVAETGALAGACEREAPVVNLETLRRGGGDPFALHAYPFESRGCPSFGSLTPQAPKAIGPAEPPKVVDAVRLCWKQLVKFGAGAGVRRARCHAPNKSK